MCNSLKELEEGLSDALMYGIEVFQIADAEIKHIPYPEFLKIYEENKDEWQVINQ